MLRALSFRTMSALLTGAVALAACSEAPTSFKSAANRPSFSVNRIAEVGEFEVCADGLTATFSVVAVPTAGGATITTTPTITGGTCQIVHTNSLDAGSFYDVTVTQTSPATPTSMTCTTINPIGPGDCAAGSASYNINAYHGALATFTNAAPVPKGCTYTQGWYKNQGASTLPKGNFALSGQTYLQVLNTPPKGNVYYILAHQYIAASQNAARIGGSPVAAQLAAAATYFSVATPANPLPAGYTKEGVTALANTLDSFNNGNYAGYPHCS